MNPSEDPAPPPVAHLRLKATLLLALMLALVLGSIVYVMYARGVFERTQRLVLMTDDSEGVGVGMDLSFSGFPIGRVRRVELAEDGRVRACTGLADLFIRPGHRFRVVDALVTNFHLPRSSLLVLVSAFAGRDLVLAAYRHALAARYRFYSYGDAMLIV